MNMIDFEWTCDLSSDEAEALRGYKDDVWRRINPGLRGGNLEGDLPEEVRLIDEAIRKGHCTTATTLYRATGAQFLKIADDIIDPGPGFLSTSLRDEGIGQFFDNDQPAKMIIRCPLASPMASFDYDNSPGDEYERLLPRGVKFRMVKREQVPNRIDPLKDEGPLNRHYMPVRCNAILVYTLELLRTDNS